MAFGASPRQGVVPAGASEDMVPWPGSRFGVRLRARSRIDAFRYHRAWAGIKYGLRKFSVRKVLNGHRCWRIA